MGDVVMGDVVMGDVPWTSVGTEWALSMHSVEARSAMLAVRIGYGGQAQPGDFERDPFRAASFGGDVWRQFSDEAFHERADDAGRRDLRSLVAEFADPRSPRR